MYVASADAIVHVRHDAFALPFHSGISTPLDDLCATLVLADDGFVNTLL